MQSVSIDGYALLILAQQCQTICQKQTRKRSTERSRKTKKRENTRLGERGRGRGCVCAQRRNHEKWHFRIANFISAYPSERSEWQQVNNKLAKVAAAFTTEDLTTS